MAETRGRIGDLPSLASYSLGRQHKTVYDCYIHQHLLLCTLEVQKAEKNCLIPRSSNRDVHCKPLRNNLQHICITTNIGIHGHTSVDLAIRGARRMVDSRLQTSKREICPKKKLAYSNWHLSRCMGFVAFDRIPL